MSIVGKGVAIITGSAQGIGRAIALRLARDGFDAALNDVSSKRDQLRAVADEIEKIGRRTLLVPADVSVDREVREMVQDVSNQLGRLDVMVANAGVSHLASLVHTELDDWERTMAINARGPFLCYKYAARQMIEQGRGGRIIGASSVLGKLAAPLYSAYTASKFAVRGLTQTAALELGKHNITVNCYAPGLIETPMTTSVMSGDHKLTNDDDLKLLASPTYFDARPVQRIGQPEEIADLVSYLASNETSFMTGKSPLMEVLVSLDSNKNKVDDQVHAPTCVDEVNLVAIFPGGN